MPTYQITQGPYKFKLTTENELSDVQLQALGKKSLLEMYTSPIPSQEEAEKLVPPKLEVREKAVRPSYTRRSARGERFQTDRKEEKKLFKALQQLYGDEDTVSTSGTRAGKGVTRYDEKELLKRQFMDETNLTPLESDNPMVHLGKTLDTIKTGIQTILPENFGGISPEEYKDWERLNRAYNLADQPLTAQLAGDLLLAAPTLGGTTALAGMGRLGMALGDDIIKAASKELLNKTAFGAHEVPTLTGAFAPGVSGFARGGAYGFVQPQDPSLTLEEQYGARVSRALADATVGMSGDIAGRKLGRMVQRNATKALRKDLQGSLPLPVEMPTPGLYKNKQGIVDLKSIANPGGEIKSVSPSARKAASSQLQAFEDSMIANFERMNRDASGIIDPKTHKPNVKVGHAINKVLAKYKALDKAAWDEVSEAYGKAAKRGSLRGYVDDYESVLYNIDQELRQNGLSPIKTSKNARRILSLNPNEVFHNKETGISTFDPKLLVGLYKNLNNLRHTAKPDQRKAIDVMRRHVRDYLKSRRFVGDQKYLELWDQATDKASAYYKKYRGDPIIDNYLVPAEETGRHFTPADVSRRIFTGEALEQAEFPKGAAIDKLLSVMPGDETIRAMRNEAFSNLTDETGRDIVKKAMPTIDRQILSGSEESVYNKIFTQKQLRQFADLKRAWDMVENPTETRMSFFQAGRYAPITMPGKKRLFKKFENRRKALRSEQGILAPATDVSRRAAMLGVKPTDRYLEEQEMLDRLIQSLEVIGSPIEE